MYLASVSESFSAFIGRAGPTKTDTLILFSLSILRILILSSIDGAPGSRILLTSSRSVVIVTVTETSFSKSISRKISVDLLIM